MGRDTSYLAEYYEWCKGNYKQLWDGKWFIRAFTDEGEKYGTDDRFSFMKFLTRDHDLLDRADGTRDFALLAEVAAFFDTSLAEQ